MKILIIIFIATVVFSHSTVFAQKKPAVAKPAVSTFESSRAWKKVSQPVQGKWSAAMKSGNPDQRIDCFVRVRAPAEMGDEAFLQSNGYDVRAFEGTIATGNLKASDLQRVAELPFVDSIR